MRPQCVWLGIQQSNSDQEGSHQSIEEGVVSEELGRHVHPAQHLQREKRGNGVSGTLLCSVWLQREAASYFLVEFVSGFPEQQGDHPLHLICKGEQSVSLQGSHTQPGRRSSTQATLTHIRVLLHLRRREGDLHGQLRQLACRLLQLVLLLLLLLLRRRSPVCNKLGQLQ